MKCSVWFSSGICILYINNTTIHNTQYTIQQYTTITQYSLHCVAVLNRYYLILSLFWWKVAAAVNGGTIWNKWSQSWQQMLRRERKIVVSWPQQKRRNVVLWWQLWEDVVGLMEIWWLSGWTDVVKWKIYGSLEGRYDGDQVWRCGG